MKSVTYDEVFLSIKGCVGGESARRRMSGERLGRSHGPEYKGLMFHVSHFELHSDGKREYLKGFK